jgi:hypothetical protein
LADFYIGSQTWDAPGDSSRWLIGFDNLRIDMGSQAHPLVRVGFYVGAKAAIDTLHISGQNPIDPLRRDLSIQINVVEFGGDIDFGGGDLPARSNLSVSYAPSQMVYAYRGTNQYSNDTLPVVDGNRHAPTIVNDSFQLFWLAQGRIPIVEDEYVVKPGLLLGWSTNSGRMHTASEKNDLYRYSDVIPNREYDFGGFYFGAGTGFELLKYADLYAEYSLASMSLNKLGSYYPQTFTKSRTLHHIAFGAATSINKYVDLPLEISPRVAYFISGSTNIVPAAHSRLDPLNVEPRKSKWLFYSPHLFLEGFAQTSGFTIGVDGLALENKLSVSYWMTFLSKKFENQPDPVGGIELGLSAGFSL